MSLKIGSDHSHRLFEGYRKLFYHRLLYFPLIVQLATGSLKAQPWQQFLSDESHFLQGTDKTMKIALSHFSKEDDIGLYRGCSYLRTSLTKEHDAVSTHLKKCLPPSQSCQDYIQLLRTLAERGEISTLVISLGPCATAYYAIAEVLNDKVKETNPYKGFFQRYADKEFSRSVHEIAILTNILFDRSLRGEDIPFPPISRLPAHIVWSRAYDKAYASEFDLFNSNSAYVYDEAKRSRKAREEQRQELIQYKRLLHGIPIEECYTNSSLRHRLPPPSSSPKPFSPLR